MELVKYDAMVNAIAECESVDEVKDIRDKAVALELYAKQANNYEAERQCGLIRVRAERQCGKMLSEREMAKGTDKGGRKDLDGQREVPSNPPKTLSEMGISKNQSSSWQKLAAVPDDEFEAAAERPGRVPKASTLVKELSPDLPEKPMPRMHKSALDWWGWLNRMESGGWLDLPLDEMLSEMTDNMREEALPKLETLRKYINAK